MSSSLVAEYKQQFTFRSWDMVFSELQKCFSLKGCAVADLGCALGDQTAALLSCGITYVVGLDNNTELLAEAKKRSLPGASFRNWDLSSAVPQDLIGTMDGIWCSFTAAYFVDLSLALQRWSEFLKPHGWIALVEVDGMLDHEPLGSTTKEMLNNFVQDAFTSTRYDFNMGHKLPAHLSQANFTVMSQLNVPDAELSFQGPASAEVAVGWRRRLERMQVLQKYCGSHFPQLREEFITCISHKDHHTSGKVVCCIAKKL